jgi:1-acyl-sn-glycerol-3-phosphate acyltransferase
MEGPDAGPRAAGAKGSGLGRIRAGRKEGSPLEPWYRVARAVALPPIKLWFNWHFEGLEHIPAEGPVLVAANHISYLDPLADAYFLTLAGRRPRFLAKSELFENPLLRTVLNGARQIPVRRGTGDPAALDAASNALAAGEAVVIYPEGTVTKNPDFSPMRARTGVARLALESGLPVVPLAIWGSQHVWQKDGRHSLRFARPIWLKAGPPIDLSAEVDAADPEPARIGTDRVTDELTQLVNDLRARYPKRWT